MKRAKVAIFKTSPARVRTDAHAPWGRLRENWEHLVPDEDGFPNVDATSAAIPRAGMHAFKHSLGILGTCINEAPEFCQPTAARAAPLGLSRRRHR